ncbi:MAG: hypothetical protein AAF617_17080 [Bacteroidota bacterium]
MKKTNLKNLQLNKKQISSLSFYNIKAGRAAGGGETSRNEFDYTSKECVTCCKCDAEVAPVRNPQG